MPVASIRPLGQDELVEAARGGDEEAFERIAEIHRAELHAHCYRMLGSLHHADDALQETLLRAWRGLPGFEGRSALRSWLYTIATNACLTTIAQRPKRVLPLEYLDSHIGTYLPAAIDVFTFDGPLITDITGFVTPAVFSRFGLSRELACAVRP